MNRSIVFVAVFIAVIFSMGERSEAQGTATGDLRVLVQYPDGSLVQDTTVCVNGYRTGDDGKPQFWFTETVYNVGARAVLESAGPDSTYTLPADSIVGLAAIACDPQAAVTFITSYHTGPEPRDGLDDSLDPMRDGIRIIGGQTTTAVLVVGEATISGQTPGAAFGSCGITVFGTPEIGKGQYRRYATNAAVDSRDGSWSARVPPGSYQIIYGCPGGSQHWPNGSTFDTAGTIRVTHGDHVRNVNFTEQTIDGGGRSYSVSMERTSALFTYCVDVVDLNGTTQTRRVNNRYFGFAGTNPGTIAQLVNVPIGDHKIRFWDCGDGTFDDVWYPNSPDFEGAEVVPGFAEGDRELEETVAFFGSSGLQCAGRAATIVGASTKSTLAGTDGNDVIVTFVGHDTVLAGAGDDVICSGSGNDIIYGGDGRDLVYAGDGLDHVHGQGDPDRIHGGSGRDRLFGGKGPDRLWGDRSSDTLDGGLGNDRLIGGAGSDTLIGNNGRRDNLVGGGNIDTCLDRQATTRRSTCEVFE
jgi:Ca2+-binding RTX toxin-like protein